MINGQDIVQKLGFPSETSSEWKKYLSSFKSEFLGARTDICKGYRYFVNLGEVIRWEKCIVDMFKAYPDVWLLEKFSGNPKERTRFGHAFLIAQTKKIRSNETESPTKGKANKRKIENASPGPSAKTQKQTPYPGLEYETFVCVVQFVAQSESATRWRIVSYQDVRDYDDLIQWIRSEFGYDDAIILDVPVHVRHPEFREIARDPAEPIRINVHDQASWNTAVLTSQLNRGSEFESFNYMPIEVNRVSSMNRTLRIVPAVTERSKREPRKEVANAPSKRELKKAKAGMEKEVKRAGEKTRKVERETASKETSKAVLHKTWTDSRIEDLKSLENWRKIKQGKLPVNVRGIAKNQLAFLKTKMENEDKKRAEEDEDEDEEEEEEEEEGESDDSTDRE